MFDPATKRGVLSDFDLAREGGPDRTPSVKDDTGTLPFLALDLLNKQASEGLVPRRYRHDAESFAWCLIYICICMKRTEGGGIGTVKPHPLPWWFTSMSDSRSSKYALVPKEFPLHKRTKPLVVALLNHWRTRYTDQILAKSWAGVECAPMKSISKYPWAKSPVQPRGPYQEYSDRGHLSKFWN